MFFDQVSQGAPDPIFGLLSAYEADQRPQKMSLMVGTYQDEHLKNLVIPAVNKAKKKVDEAGLVANYLPIDGSAEFCNQIGALCFGAELWSGHRDRIYGAQAVGGTGALRVGAEFLAQELRCAAGLPQPTWPNHRSIFERAGFAVESLNYYSEEKHGFDKEDYLAALKALPEKSVALFHCACHNPTGSDPTLEDWREISDLCKQRSLFPFFDFAYQGFGDGMERDAAALRLFLREGHELVVAYSCSKNFSLYSQRVGALFVVTESGEVRARVGSQVKKVIRAMYSNPPAYGAHVATAVLKDHGLREEWMREVEQMRERINSVRRKLVEKLRARAGNRFEFLLNHKGMFSYLDLTKLQVTQLIERHAIYTLDSGRINVAGLNERNIDYFVDSLIQVLRL